MFGIHSLTLSSFFSAVTTLIAGILFSMLVAFIGGANMAAMEYDYGISHINR